MAHHNSATCLSQMSSEAMVASIVIITHRRNAMLAELLAALRPQLEGRAVEVIVIDNCGEAGARAVVEACQDSALRYIHEARSGVVHARNRGTMAAQGAYVIFLDDDEIPGPGWLDAWLVQADGRTDMSFGRIVPRLLAPCPDGLLRQVERNFSRDLNQPTGADISSSWVVLGTGNAMFHKGRCLGQAEPFDLRFNARGGEDVWLIRSLVQNGHRLLWNHDAVVEELVPEDRMTRQSLALRRFNQGQLRCILMFGDGGLVGLARAAFWMAVGAAQVIGFRSAALLASALAPKHAPDFLCEASGGAGKLLWWQRARMRGYGSAPDKAEQR